MIDKDVFKEFEQSIEFRNFEETELLAIIDVMTFEGVFIPHNKLDDFIDCLVYIKEELDKRKEFEVRRGT